MEPIFNISPESSPNHLEISLQQDPGKVTSIATISHHHHNHDAFYLRNANHTTATTATTTTTATNASMVAPNKSVFVSSSAGLIREFCFQQQQGQNLIPMGQKGTNSTTVPQNDSTALNYASMLPQDASFLREIRTSPHSLVESLSGDDATTSPTSDLKDVSKTKQQHDKSQLEVQYSPHSYKSYLYRIVSAEAAGSGSSSSRSSSIEHLEWISCSRSSAHESLSQQSASNDAKRAAVEHHDDNAATMEPRRNLFLILMDGCVQCVNLERAEDADTEQELKCTVHSKCMASKGCSMFCVQNTTQRDIPAPASCLSTSTDTTLSDISPSLSERRYNATHSLQFVCLIKKRLLFFKFNLLQKDFQYTKTINLSYASNEVPRNITWSHNYISLSFNQRDPHTINSQTGEPIDAESEEHFSVHLSHLTACTNVNNQLASTERSHSQLQKDIKNFNHHLALLPMSSLSSSSAPQQKNSDSKTSLSTNPQWSDAHPKRLFVVFPFVVALCSNVVDFFNLFTAHCTSFSSKNSNQLSFSKSQHICSSEPLLFISSQQSLLVVSLPSISSHIRALLRETRVDDAFTLFRYLLSISVNVNPLGLSTMTPPESEISNFIMSFTACSSHLLFRSLKFKVAMSHFERAQVDPREVIAYFPDLVHPSIDKPASTFTHTPSITELIEQQISEEESFETHLKAARKHLLKYLETVRHSMTSLPKDSARAVDYAICNLYISSNNPLQLKHFLLDRNQCQIEDIEYILNSQENHSASMKASKYLAYLLWNKQKHDRALDLLQKVDVRMNTSQQEENNFSLTILDTDDDNNTPIQDMIQLLSECTDKDIIWKYLPYILDNNYQEAMSLFTNDSLAVQFTQDEVLNFLQEYPNEVQRIYMEQLILHHNVTEPRIHTRLALNYIQSILKLKPHLNLQQLPFGARVKAGEESGFLGALRKSLLDFLKHPRSNYNVKRILRILKPTSLHEEKIEIYKRLQDHTSVLRLLVYSIKDLEWAETYCLQIYDEMRIEEARDRISSSNAQFPWMQVQSEETTQENTQKGSEYANLNIYNPLWLLLLQVCFVENPTNYDFGVKILKKHSRSIDPVKSLGMLPDSLTFGDLGSYVLEIVKNSTHNQHESSVMESMYQQHYAKSESILARSLSRRIHVKESSACAVCKKKLGKSVLAVFPDLLCVHYKCGVASSHEGKHPISKFSLLSVPEPIEKQFSEDDVLFPKTPM